MKDARKILFHTEGVSRFAQDYKDRNMLLLYHIEVIKFVYFFPGGLRKPPIIPLVPPRIETTGRVHRVQERTDGSLL